VTRVSARPFKRRRALAARSPNLDDISRFAESRALAGKQAAVLRLSLFGFTELEIADRLGLSRPLVRDHVQSLYRAFNVANRTELLLTCVREQSAQEHVRLAKRMGTDDRRASLAGATFVRH
jgi:DNA-binding CsgD family transcriptional regulator